jgi:fluoroacetyl-CoA thioesterase
MPSKRGIDRMQLKPGLVGTATLVVGEEHTAPHLGSGRAPVLASPIMIALMEAAAVDCVERRLPDGQESLGVRVEVEHTAPTPVGLGVTATAELKEVNGRRLSFDVEARDDREVIGKGRHTRVIVDAERFRSKVRAKAAADG